MTAPEKLIQQPVDASVVTSLGRTTDKIAEEMAREILNDPRFRPDAGSDRAGVRAHPRGPVQSY